MNNKGAALQEVGRTSEAMEVIEQALYLDTGYVDAWLNKAIIQISHKGYTEALTSLAEAQDKLGN